MTREEAINEIRSWDNLTRKEIEALHTLIPELRESEDERIRKGIIEIIKAVSGPDCDVYLDEKKQEKYLAWLEKQKEQKHPDGCFTRDEYKKGYEEGRRNGFTAGYNKGYKDAEEAYNKSVAYHLDIPDNWPPRMPDLPTQTTTTGGKY